MLLAAKRHRRPRAFGRGACPVLPPGAFRTSGFPSGRLIRLLGDGGHYRKGISGVLLDSKLTNPGFVKTAMTLGKWKVEKDFKNSYAKRVAYLRQVIENGPPTLSWSTPHASTPFSIQLLHMTMRRMELATRLLQTTKARSFGLACLRISTR